MQVKIVRVDRELECHHVDQMLRDSGANLVLLPDGVSEEELARETRDAELILMCYTPITARVINGAEKLKGIVKYGVGIDAIDIDAAKAREIPVVNIPEYAEETVAEAAFALMIALAKKLIPLHKTMRSDGWAWPESRWIASDDVEPQQSQKCGSIGFWARSSSHAKHDSQWTSPTELVYRDVERKTEEQNGYRAPYAKGKFYKAAAG